MPFHAFWYAAGHRGGHALAAFSLLFALAGQASAQSQNPSITISDNSVHIDRGTLYSGLSFLTASGGTAPYSFTIDPTTPLPTGITVASSGTISGATCGSNGSYRLTVTATDANGDFNTQNNLSLIVNRAPAQGCALTFNQSTLPDGTQGVAYSQTLTVSGASGSVTYSLVGGSLPNGLSLSSSGTISGTPTTVQTSTFAVYATDASGSSGSQTFSITIVAVGGLTLSPASLAAGSQGTPYSQTITASGGTGPYSYAVTSGTLPAGLSLNTSTGAITGTPTSAGSSTFTIQATDTLGATGSRSYTVNIGSSGLTISPTSLPAGTQGVAYSQTISASGGTPAYTYSITSGSLPTGLSLNSSTGDITGTPTAGGSSTFTIQALDSIGNTGTRPYTVNIGTNSLAVNPASLPAGTQGIAYNQTVTAAGGTAPYTFSVSSGSLPTGLSLNSTTGAITGTPTGSGSSSFTVQAFDSNGNTGTRPYTVNIGTNSLTVNPASLPAGTQGVAYNQAVTASGGTAPYTFSVSSGSLPAGLSLNASTGAITGTPTGSGASIFTIQVSDSGGNTGSRSYTINIGTNSLSVNPASLPAGTQGVAYNQTVTATGGTAPYTFLVSSGALPAGLSLNASTGAITGTPTGSGASSFIIQARDSNGNTGNRPYTVNIGTSLLAVNPASLPAGTQGVAYNQTITATGGTAPYTFSVSSGSLPAGLSLNSGTGAITGTPTGSGASSFTVQARDGNGNTGSRSYTVNVGTNSLTVGPSSLPPSTLGVPYNQTVTASGGTAPYTYTITSGSLPPGLSLDQSTGAIRGTTTTNGTFIFAIQARDSFGNVGARTFMLTTRSNPALDPEVQGLVAAQAAAARRFADGQVTNVMRRLEQLHQEADPCGIDISIGVSTPYQDRNVIPPGALAPVQEVEAIPRTAAALLACEKDRIRQPSISMWSSGAMELGTSNLNGLPDRQRFSTSGITVGADGRFADQLALGLAVGFGFDRTKIGVAGTANDANTVASLIYASYRPYGGWFIDGTLGSGALNFSTRRWVTDDSSVVEGRRSGSYWLASMALGLEQKLGMFRIVPYLRGDYFGINLKGYAETGSSNFALTYADTKLDTRTMSLGLRGSYDIAADWGMIAPNVRVEYKRAFDSRFAQSMFYNDIGSIATYDFVQTAAARNTLSGILGIRVRTRSALTFDAEYGVSIGSNSLQSQILRGTLRVPY